MGLKRQKNVGQAWETVSEGGGPGQAITQLASLAGDPAANLPNASTQDLLWTVTDTPIGSGIVLNADRKPVELDDGWYQITVMLAAFSDTAQARDLQLSVDGLANDPWNIYTRSGDVPSPSGTIVLAVPPILFNAGQPSFTVQAYGEHAGNADTWSVGSALMRVWALST